MSANLPMESWKVWLGVIVVLALLVRGVILIFVGRKLWGIIQLATTLIFLLLWGYWQLSQVVWMQYVVLAWVPVLLVPPLLYQHVYLKKTLSHSDRQEHP